MSEPYDAVLIVSFGGPEGHDDVMPFLQNVTRGRNVPDDRLLEVAEHYYEFDGVSPINQQCRDMIDGLEVVLKTREIDLPIYWGNRNWHPMLETTLRQMKRDGIKNALAFVTSAYSGYSSCRQYREDIELAQMAVGRGAPKVTKLRQFYDHPGFIRPFVEATQDAVERMREQVGYNARIAFTAHSIPTSMGKTSMYQNQLLIASQLVADLVMGAYPWELVFQSRSGSPSQPWLTPDICDHIESLYEIGIDGVIVVPIGFVSDHLEVKYDLDHEASRAARKRNMQFERVPTPGSDDRFSEMIADLVEEKTRRLEPAHLAEPLKGFSPCASDCCPSPAMLAAL